MSFIDTIPPSEATGATRAMYEHQQSDWGYVPNYAKTFCWRPELMTRWGRLLAEAKRYTDPRRREMATFVVAHELKHSPCSLAHGNMLAEIAGKDIVLAIARGEKHDDITDAEYAIMDFARAIARDASAIEAGQVDALKQHGLTDPEIFDIAAIAAARCFFTKILDALGSEPDSGVRSMDAELLEHLTVGRPISDAPTERI